MNKIQHTVWNETTGTWVAVQETARAKGKKSNSVKASVGMALALASLAGFSGVASAAIKIKCITLKYSDHIHKKPIINKQVSK